MTPDVPASAPTAPGSRDDMLPLAHRVVDRHEETGDCVTLTLAPLGPPTAPFRPGQFTMLYRPGVGEVAVSISGPPGSPGGRLSQTVRAVGAVSRAVHDARPGDVLGVRGPYGTGWGLDGAARLDVLLVAGGLGLAPLRPVLFAVLGRRARYGRLILVAGARRPQDFLYRDQLPRWAAHGLEVELTVDQPADGWSGGVGFVTEPLAHLELDPRRTAAFVCGPEPMMRFSAQLLIDRGVPAERVEVSLERNMKCGIGLCGHCQLGPVLLCRDGPVLDYPRAEPLLHTREL